MKLTKVEFLTSVTGSDSIPKFSLPAVAFAGRSNVGKSSLINVLLNRKNIARTSSTPGKTRRIHYFNINDRLHMVDLPGYGYARVSHSMRENWRNMIEHFLTNNPAVHLVIVIIDVRRGITDFDRQLLDWLNHKRMNVQIVVTKVDKVSKSGALNVRNDIIRNNTLINEPILFSAVKKTGVTDVWNVILSACSLKL